MNDRKTKFVLCFLIVFKEIVRWLVGASLGRWVFELFICAIYFVGLCFFIKQKSVKKHVLYFIYFFHDICAPIYYTIYHLSPNKFLIAGYEYEFMIISGIFVLIFIMVAVVKLLKKIGERLACQSADGSVCSDEKKS